MFGNKIPNKGESSPVSGGIETCNQNLVIEDMSSPENFNTNVSTNNQQCIFLTQDQLSNLFEELNNIINKVQSEGIIIKTSEINKLNFKFHDLFTNCENYSQLAEIEKLATRLLDSQRDNTRYSLIANNLNSYKETSSRLLKQHNMSAALNSQQLSQKMETEKITDNGKRQRKSPPSEDEFTKPKKTCFLGKYIKPSIETAPIITQNRFSHLTDESSGEDEEENNTATTQQTKDQPKKFKLPPIVITKKFENHKALTNDLRKKITKRFLPQVYKQQNFNIR